LDQSQIDKVEEANKVNFELQRQKKELEENIKEIQQQLGEELK